MPDVNGDPTDGELVSSLGWTESEGDALAGDITVEIGHDAFMQIAQDPAFVNKLNN